MAKIEFGNAVLLMILNAESLEESKNDDFKKCVQTAKNMSRQPEDLKTKINETAKNFKETLVGPIISGILLLLLSIIVFSARDSIYAFGTSGLEIPNFISGTVILAMAYFAYKQKITLTYFFMLFSAFWSIFGLMMDGEGYLFILFLLEVSIIIAISVRHKDFGYNHVKELFQESFKS